ncbi:MAG: hypothetical protein KIT00_07270, partial [Rhodospirillales bacterium]|nr:hypothetical protein [Rhodospirillales bacterium]
MPLGDIGVNPIGIGAKTLCEYVPDFAAASFLIKDKDECLQGFTFALKLTNDRNITPSRIQP